jgi:hypothetical protein
MEILVNLFSFRATHRQHRSHAWTSRHVNRPLSAPWPPSTLCSRLPRSAIVSKQIGRASIYMGAVSSALIALGFLAQVAAINSILAGAGLAVLAARVADLGDGAALAVGAAVALVLFVLHLLYQQRRSAHVGRGR